MMPKRNPASELAHYESEIKRGMMRALWVIAYREWAVSTGAIDPPPQFAEDPALDPSSAWDWWDDEVPPTPAHQAEIPTEILAKAIGDVNDISDAYPLAFLYLHALALDQEDGQEFAIAPLSRHEAGIPTDARRIGRMVYKTPKEAAAASERIRKHVLEEDPPERYRNSPEREKWVAWRERDAASLSASVPVTEEWWLEEERRRLRDSYDEAVLFGESLAHMACATKGRNWFEKAFSDGTLAHVDFELRLPRLRIVLREDLAGPEGIRRLIWDFVDFPGGVGNAPIFVIDNTMMRFGRLELANPENDGERSETMWIGIFGANMGVTARYILAFADRAEEALELMADMVAANWPGLTSNEEVGGEISAYATFGTDEDGNDGPDLQDYWQSENGDYFRRDTFVGWLSQSSLGPVPWKRVLECAFPEGVPQ